MVIRPLRQAPTLIHNGNERNPLPEFCNELKVGQDIIVCVFDEEREDNPGKECFVAKIEGKAKEMEEDGVYGTVTFRKIIG